MLPGWNDLDSAKRMASEIDVGTILGWSFTLIFEGLARFWKKFSHLFDVLALVAFALAISGEWVGHKYGQREDFLYNQQQQETTQAFQAEFNGEDAKLKKAEGDASDAESQLQELKRDQAGRVLTSRQRSVLLAQLKAIPPQHLYFVCSPDPESEAYLNQLSVVFRKVGWQVGPAGIQLGFRLGTYVTGLRILVKDPKAAPLGAAALQAALRKAGIDAPGMGSFPFLIGKEEFALYIGPKPHP